MPDNLVKTYIKTTTKLLSEYPTTNVVFSGYSHAYVLDSNVVINAGQTKSYNLYAWVTSEATLANAQNKTWISKLRLVAVPV